MQPAGTPPPLTVLSTDGVTLELHDLGGSGPNLLLTHATGFHGLVWQPLFSHLDGFHGWAPDLRGHGSSTAPDTGDFGWEGFGRDVLAIVDALQTETHQTETHQTETHQTETHQTETHQAETIRTGMHQPIASDQPIYAVGHSKGGAALLLAEQARPGTFSALYLFEPVVFPGNPIGSDGKPLENPLAAGARRRRGQFASRDEAFDNFASKPPLSVLDRAALHAYVDHGFIDGPAGPSGEPVVELACSPENEARTYEGGLAHRAFDHLDRVRCPVVIATGRPDDPGPAAFGPPIADSLPDGRLEVFETLGHFGPLEDPALVASAVQRFFHDVATKGLPPSR